MAAKDSYTTNAVLRKIQKRLFTPSTLLAAFSCCVMIPFCLDKKNHTPRGQRLTIDVLFLIVRI